MGNATSGQARFKHDPDDEPTGYRVLSVEPHGPATQVRVLKVCRA